MQSVEIDLFEEKLNEDKKKYNKENENVIMDDESDRRLKITLNGKDYEKYKTAIVQFVKELEKQDIKVRQKDIIDYYIENNLDQIDGEKQALEETTKILAVVERLVNKENILIVTQENDNKPERVLSLNVNYDPTLSL